MARREKDVTITAEGRDKGKVFHLTELPCVAAEDWFSRAMLIISRSGVEVPPNIFSHGPAGFAVLGIGAVLTGFGKAPFPEVRALMAEMWPCVAYKSPAGPLITDAMQVDLWIEEVATRLQLREEIISLHLGFSLAVRLSTLRQMADTMIAGLPTMPTSDALPVH